ncbi:MAG TPA: FAD-dependent oxidoreductase [Steroidobacteraceae bacterium]|nr:FAD-dependent oxidoreductase [Steroidobacteraceae bacterium]
MTHAEKPAPAEVRAPGTAIVVGGGIVGLACSVELQRRGIATLMLDPAMLPRSASWGNAGHIATEQVEPLAAPGALASLPRRLFSRGGAAAFPVRDFGAWLPFGWRLLRASRPERFNAGKSALKSLVARALPAWQRLTTATGTSAMLADDGHFVVWESEARAKAGRERWARSDIGTASFQGLTSQELGWLSSLVGARPVDGLRFSGTGRVRDPGELHESLARAFTQSGGECHRASVAGIELDRSHARARLAGGAVLDADLIVVAAGVASAQLLRPLGHRAPVIAERGYHLQAPSAAWPDMPPVVFEDRSMIVSRFNSGLRAASFVEFSRVTSPPDPRKWQRLRAHAQALRLPFDGEPLEWMGVRPTLPDYLPAIGRSAQARNLLYAFGHQHLGLTLAAVTAELIGDLAENTPPPVDLAPFDVRRFGGA